MIQYDLIVIGAGSAGLVAATTANRLGLKTAMIEKDKIGGECTHYGCVPSKALINAGKAYSGLLKMKDLGIPIEQPALDFGEVMQKVDDIVQGIYAHETPDIFEKQGIDVFVNESGAQFVDDRVITIGNATLTATNFIICSGSSPVHLQIPGIEKATTYHNENFWELREMPKSLAFIGGGVISVELGQAMQRFGCDVTIIDRNDRILKVTEPEIGAYLSNQLEEEGITLLTEANTVRFQSATELVVEQNGEEIVITADAFFLAAGRSANTKGMQLENAGVEYTNRGITTNEYLQTSKEHIYSCGDVTTPYKFTHTASHQANICIDNVMKGNVKKNDLSILPWGIFTDPEIGHVGLTEAEAIEKLGEENISIFKVDAAIDRFITDRKVGGFLQVIFNSDDEVVGAQAVGALAAEWIQCLTIAIKNKIKAEVMADTIFSYPTYSEIVKKAFTRYLRTKN